MSTTQNENSNAVENWSLNFDCIGIGWWNNSKPCKKSNTITTKHLIKRSCIRYDKDKLPIAYGFICENCNCFTEIPVDSIPDEIKKECREI